MSGRLPTPAEYQRMSWHARRVAVDRLRAAERKLERSRDPRDVADAAAELLELLPEPPEVLAARRAAIDVSIRRKR